MILYKKTLSSNRLNVCTSLTLGGLSLLIYFLTLAPTIGWGDSADLALRLAILDSNDFAGTSRDYKLYREIGHLFQFIPIGDAGTRANLFTAFCGAISVGITTYFTGWVLRNGFCGVVAGTSLAISHTFWFLSVTAEVYTFNLVLVLLSFLLIALWSRDGDGYFLVLTFFFVGASLNHHATGLLLVFSIFPILYYYKRKISIFWFVVAFITFISTSNLYWFGVFKNLGEGQNLLTAMGLISSNNPFFDAQPLKELAKFIGFYGYNFFGIAFLLSVWGLFISFKNRIILLLPPAIWAFALVVAGINSTIPDKFNIYVLACPTLSIMAGVGMYDLFNKKKFSFAWKIIIISLLIFFPVSAYYSTVLLSRALSIDIVGARIAPFRDNALYFLWPPKNDDYGPRNFAESALDQLEPDSILISDYTLIRPLMVLQKTEGRRLDVELVFVERYLKSGVVNYIANNYKSKNIYLATNNPPRYYQLDQILDKYNLVKSGIVYHVIKK